MLQDKLCSHSMIWTGPLIQRNYWKMENVGDEASNEIARSTFKTAFKFPLPTTVTGCLEVKNAGL